MGVQSESLTGGSLVRWRRMLGRRRASFVIPAVLFAAALFFAACAAPPIVVEEKGERAINLGAYSLKPPQGYSVVYTRADNRERGLFQDVAMLSKGTSPGETMMAFVYIKASPGQLLPSTDLDKALGEPEFKFRVKMPVPGIEGTALTYVARRAFPRGKKGQRELCKNFTWYAPYPSTMYRIDVFQRFAREPEPGPALDASPGFREGLVKFHDYSSELLRKNLSKRSPW